MKTRGKLIAAAVVGLMALGGYQAHEHPHPAAPVAHARVMAMAEGAAGPVAVAHPTRVRPARHHRAATAAGARVAAVHFRPPHLHLGLWWLFHPRLVPWWMRPGRRY